jgi:hypothetical protein
MPFIPAHGMRRGTFTPRPSDFRFYHTHNRAGADLHAGQSSGQVARVVPARSIAEPGEAVQFSRSTESPMLGVQLVAPPRKSLIRA